MSYVARPKPSESRKPEDGYTLGLRGYVFGQHWGETQGRRVNEGGHQDWNYDVMIRWKPPGEERISYAGHRKGEPLISTHCNRWTMFETGLQAVESNLNFPIREHVKELIAQNPSRKPVILEWGCGAGNAVKDLTNEPEIKGKTLIFGYGNVWDADWNKVNGVKFLFFVKEHLAEYLRRADIQLDFVFTHGAMNYLRGEELVKHLRDLATVIVSGGTLLFDSNYARAEFAEITDLFSVTSSSEDLSKLRNYLLTKK